MTKVVFENIGEGSCNTQVLFANIFLLLPRQGSAKPPSDVEARTKHICRARSRWGHAHTGFPRLGQGVFLARNSLFGTLSKRRCVAPVVGCDGSVRVTHATHLSLRKRANVCSAHRSS